MGHHPTVQVQSQASPTALVFIGPPASGKTTLRTLCEDFDAVGLDLEQFHSHGAVTDDGYHDAIESAVAEAAQSTLGVCCIEGAVSDDEVSAVRQHATATLVVRVRVADSADRVTRYVERELEAEPGDLRHEARETAIRDYAHARETIERPYPDHDVTITNGDDVPTSELLSRVAHLLTVASMADQPLVGPDKPEAVDADNRPEYLQTMGAERALSERTADTDQIESGLSGTDEARSVDEIVSDVTVRPENDR